VHALEAASLYGTFLIWQRAWVHTGVVWCGRVVSVLRVCCECCFGGTGGFFVVCGADVLASKGDGLPFMASKGACGRLGCLFGGWERGVAGRHRRGSRGVFCVEMMCVAMQAPLADGNVSNVHDMSHHCTHTARLARSPRDRHEIATSRAIATIDAATSFRVASDWASTHPSMNNDVLHCCALNLCVLWAEWQVLIM